MSCSGKLVVFNGTHGRVRLTPRKFGLGTDARIVVSIIGPRGLRILGTVTNYTDTEIELYIQRIVHKDKRDYPRVRARLDIRYHVLTEKDSETIRTAWRKGIQEVSHVINWTSPNPYINFSRSGLQFTDKQLCKLDDRLMIELTLPNSSILHRLVGKVVRVDELSEEACARNFEAVQVRRRDDTHSFAVQFESVAHSVEEALSRATVEQQMKEIEWKQNDRSKLGG